MIRKKANWFSVLFVAVLTLTISLAGAQYPGTDYPTLGGSDGRPNRAGLPTAASPGIATLGWRSPAIGNAFASSFNVDNTDFALNNFNPPFKGGPYDFNARGSADSVPNVSGTNNPTINWGWPSFPSAPLPPNQASGAYDPIARQFALGVLQANFNLRAPAYFMTACTPSAAGTDPTQAANPADLRYFEWNYKWNPQDPPYTNIFVNLPLGPTQTSGTGYNYPVEFYVFEIFYYDSLGNQQQYVQVVDTAAVGTSYVQLGLLHGSTGAFPVNAPPAGTNAVTVRLLNTVPRDPGTGLLLQQLNGQPIPTGSESLVKQFLVYADTTRFSPAIGAIYGTPTAATLTNGAGIRVTTATNLPQSGLQNGLYVSSQFGEVDDYVYNANVANGIFPNGQYGVSTWKYTPIENGTQVVNTAPSSSSAGFVTQTGPAPFQGSNYLAAVVSNVLPAGTATATYAPNLISGSYNIYAFMPGVVAGQNFATQARVDIVEGTNVTTLFVNEAATSGWVRIGTRAYNNNAGGTGALSVIIRNYSPAVADQGKFVYANYVRFQGSSNLSIVATPIHAAAHIALTPGGTPTLKDVVIAFDEKGVIHCLDATGNGNGGTTEYWSYPSTPTTDPNWFDPNTDKTKDTHPITGGLYDGTGGNTLAEMPSGFGFSSGVVETFTDSTNVPHEYLFVTTTNGRVYSIAMQGRGDFNAQLTQAGTTQRAWTFPATYPSVNPIPNSSLGAFQGSPAFGQANGTPALFVPTMQGRMYCLNAFPNNFYSANNPGTTTPIWAYPAVNQPAIGPIAVTPALDNFGGNSPFPMLFFGTQILNDNPAQFFALNANTGAVVWSYNAIFDPVSNVTNPFFNFISSPCTVSAAMLNQVPNDATNLTPPTPNVDTVYTANANNYIYAFNAETGALSWQSNDLPAGIQGALTYSVVTTWNFSGIAQQPFPMIMVPTLTTQRFYGEMARPYDVNFFGGHLGWGTNFLLNGQGITGSISNADNWMYAGDTGGNLYALDSIINSALAFENDPFYPPNSPQARSYAYTKVRIITQAQYNALVQGNQTYQAGTATTGADTRNPVAFDWGETAYIEVYDFPYSAESTTSGNTTATSQPTQANITVSTPGYNGRMATAASQQFISGAPTAPNTNVLLDGYAVYPYTFAPSGQTAVAPGKGTMSITLNTYQANGQPSTVALEPGLAPVPIPAEVDPPTIGWSQLGFIMANPLAVEIVPAPGTNNPDQSIGWLSNPADTASASAIGNPGDQQNQFNGSFNIAPTGGVIPAGTRWDLMQATPGAPVSHNTTGQFMLNVYDRSLVGLVYPAGQGLIAKVDRHDIVWEGNHNNVWSILNSTLFPNFEDYPDSYPNTSLDYPNISRDSINVTGNPTTTPSATATQGTVLTPPLYHNLPISVTNNPSGASDRVTGETGVPTPLLFQIQVPLYQPANLAYDPLTPGSVPSQLTGATMDEFGSYALSQGYMARTNIFVDAGGTGTFSSTSTSGDAYRSLQLTLGVPPSPNLLVATPSVDLGAVPSGQSYNLSAQTANGTVAQTSPWLQFNPNAGYYQQFILQNNSNVNFLDLRVAKAASFLNSASNLFYDTWAIPSANNDPAGYLDSFFDVWSNMDAADAPPNPNNNTIREVILQKPRVTDTVPTELSVNPKARQNPNLGLAGDVALRADYPSGALGLPNIGVTVPIGLPVGVYSQLMRVVENVPYAPAYSNEILDQFGANSYETYSDPSFNLSFTVTETRLTGNSTPASYLSPPMLEDQTTGNNSNVAFHNVQPAALRDPFGGLVAAWVSDRPEFAPNTPPTQIPNPIYRIYLAGLGNKTQFTQNGMTPPVNPSVPFSSESPLFDIDWFTPSSQNSWFNPSVSSQNGYPSGSTAALAGLFTNAPAGQTVNGVSFGSPSFAADGMVDKLGLSGSSVYTQAIMGFVGEAQLSGNGGVANAATGSNLSGLFLAPVQPTAVTGSVSVGNPILVAPDYSIQKGKPAIVQRSNTSALVFYPGTSANASEIYYTLFNGTTATPPYPLNFGGGFQSVDSVSATSRFSVYPSVTPVVEMTFGGKLRGEKSDEIFIGQLPLTPTGTQLRLDANLNPMPFMDLSPETFEQLSATSDAGVYRSRGVDYDTVNAPIHLVQVTAGGSAATPGIPTWTNLLMDGWGDPNFGDPNGPWDAALNFNANNNTLLVDRATGIISCDTRLGGKVYIDPALGTVKFVGGVPSAAAVIRLSYQPRFMRVSDTAGAYSSPSGLFDTRVTSDPLDLSNGQNAASFVWRKADSGSKTFGDSWVTLNDITNPNNPVTNDRFVFTYNRSASGAGQASRPYMTTRRMGVPLQYPIYVSPNTVPGFVQVLWNIGGTWTDPSPVHYYQIDPVNGKIYFEGLDEGAQVKVTYQAVDPSTGQLLNNGNNGLVTEIDTAAQIQETAETPILMNSPVNESGLNTFLDPFSYTSLRRPPLMWMFWTSTRNGTPDIYFETVSPMLIPRPNGQGQ